MGGLENTSHLVWFGVVPTPQQLHSPSLEQSAAAPWTHNMQLSTPQAVFRPERAVNRSPNKPSTGSRQEQTDAGWAMMGPGSKELFFLSLNL